MDYERKQKKNYERNKKMRYEYKIKVDADMFGWNRNGEDPLDAEGVVVQLKRDFASRR